MDLPILDDIPAYVGQSERAAADPGRSSEPRVMGLVEGDDVSCRFVRSRRGAWLYTRAAGSEEWPTWLICQPGLEESIHARSSLATLSRQLAVRRQASLSVDYEGDGYSDGDVATVGLSEWSDDVIDAVSERSGRAIDTILGIRLGALVALNVARQLTPRRLVLVDPVFDGETWFKQALRSNLTTQLTAFRKVVESRDQMFERVRSGNGTCSLGGYDVGQRFLQSVIVNTTRSTAAGLLALKDATRLNLLFGNEASAQSAADLVRMLGTGVDIQVIQTQHPPIWSEAAMSGPGCETFQESMLAMTNT